MAQEILKGVIVVDLKTDNEDSGYEIAARMAREMLAIKKRNGNCLPQDLNDVGFTPQQVADHWEKARSLMGVIGTLENWKG